MFFGEFEYKIDQKGRAPIPPKFREELKGGIVLTPGAEQCITAYSLAEWQKLASALTSSSISRSKARKLNRAIFATAFHVSLDGQGRIVLPAPLRQYAAIETEVVIAGLNSYFELWGKKQWEIEKADSREQAWQIIEGLEKRANEF